MVRSVNRPKRTGTVTTFYAYKGGSGRSMMLANVAWALATHGYRVLALDCDLEAPGLHRYFHPFLLDPDQDSQDGTVDAIWDHVGRFVEGTDDLGADHEPGAGSSWKSFVQSLQLPSDVEGAIDFIGAGRQDDRYAERVGGLDWTRLYADFAGGELFGDLTTWARQNYDFVLVDSRTGVSDSAGICLVQLPDTVVLTFVYNRQSIEGSAAVARSAIHIREREKRSRPLAILPVPTRVQDKTAAGAARRYAAFHMAHLVGRDAKTTERALRVAEIRHYPWCAYEEKLAAFEEEPQEKGSLLEASHVVASQLAGRTLSPIEVDRSQLASMWKAVAFADPRLAELETNASLPPTEAAMRLHDWMMQALERPNERADWIFALAAACASASTSPTGSFMHELGDVLSRGSLELTRRLSSQGKLGKGPELARALIQRSSFLEARQRPDEALLLIEEAQSLIEFSNDLPQVRAEALYARARLTASATGPSTATPLFEQSLLAFEWLDDFRHPNGDQILSIARTLIHTYAKENRIDKACMIADRAMPHRLGKATSPLLVTGFLLIAASAYVAGHRLEDAERAIAEADERIAPMGHMDSSTVVKVDLAYCKALLAATRTNYDAASEQLELAFRIYRSSETQAIPDELLERLVALRDRVGLHVYGPSTNGRDELALRSLNNRAARGRLRRLLAELETDKSNELSPEDILQSIRMIVAPNGTDASTDERDLRRLEGHEES